MSAQEISIERCTHDRDNPYLMLSVGLTRDSRLSIEDLGFLTILLDHPNNFKFNVPYLVKRCCISKEKARKLLNKLIDIGYVVSSQIRIKGKFTGMVYRVFEKPLAMVEKVMQADGLQIKDVKQIEDVDIGGKNTVYAKTAHGESVSGELASNKYDTQVTNNKINTNVCMFKKVLEKFELKIDDYEFNNALLIRGCEPIKDQAVLDAYLVEFNKKSADYVHLSKAERKNNLAIFIKRCIDHNAKNQKKNEDRTGKKGERSLKQISFLARALVHDHVFGKEHGNSGESMQSFESRIRRDLLNPEKFNEYKGYMLDMGLLS